MLGFVSIWAVNAEFTVMKSVWNWAETKVKPKITQKIPPKHNQ